MKLHTGFHSGIKELLCFFFVFVCSIVLFAAPLKVQLAWDMPTDSPIAVTNIGLYWGPTSGHPTNHYLVGAVTNTFFTNLVAGGHYFFTVTALGGGLESGPSNEVDWQVPLSSPSNLRFTTTIQTSSNLKTWVDTGQVVMTDTQGMAFYRVYISSSPVVSSITKTTFTPLTTKGIRWPFGEVKMAPKQTPSSTPPVPFLNQ